MIAFSMSEASNQIANILSFFSPGCLTFSIGWGRGGKAVEDLKKKKISSSTICFVWGKILKLKKKKYNCPSFMEKIVYPYNGDEWYFKQEQLFWQQNLYRVSVGTSSVTWAFGAAGASQLTLCPTPHKPSGLAAFPWVSKPSATAENVFIMFFSSAVCGSYL